MVNIVVLVPMYGAELFYGTAFGLLSLQNIAASRGARVNVRMKPQAGIITRARNTMLHEVIRDIPDATHVLWLDADIGFDAEDVFKMLEADKDVIAGAYRLKIPQVIYPYQETVPPQHEGDLVKVEKLTTGFKLVKIEVFKLMIAKYWDQYYIDEFGQSIPALYDTEIVDHHYLTEDYSFCRLWIQMGGECWVDTSISLGHLGTHVYSKFS